MPIFQPPPPTFTGGAQPYGQTKLVPVDLNPAPVNDPPLDSRTRQITVQSANSWYQAQAFSASYPVPGLIGVGAWTPALVVATFTPSNAAALLSQVASAWNPLALQPVVARNLSPSITAVPVNEPPYTMTSTIAEMAMVYSSWPQGWLASGPPQSVLPGWSVDNPPPMVSRQINWPDPTQPVQPRPGIAAALFVAAVSAMPPYLVPQWLAGVIASWTPTPTPLPPQTLIGAANLGSVVTPSDNPPFSSRYDTMILNVTGQWSQKQANEAVIARTWTNSATVVVPPVANTPPFGSPITLSSAAIATGYWVKLREDTAVVAQPQTHIASILAPVILNVLPSWLVPAQIAQILQSWATPALPPQTLTGAANLPSIITPSDNPPFARQVTTALEVIANAWTTDGDSRVVWPKRIISFAVQPVLNLVGRIRGEIQAAPRGTRAERNRAEPQTGPTGRRIDP